MNITAKKYKMLKNFIWIVLILENYIKYIKYLDKKSIFYKISSDLFDKLVYKEKRFSDF